jgi:hypothetical protein
LRLLRHRLDDLRAEHENLHEMYKRARCALEEGIAGQREAERQSEVAIASLAFAEEMRLESERCVPAVVQDVDPLTPPHAHDLGVM